ASGAARKARPTRTVHAARVMGWTSSRILLQPKGAGTLPARCSSPGSDSPQNPARKLATALHTPARVSWELAGLVARRGGSPVGIVPARDPQATVAVVQRFQAPRLAGRGTVAMWSIVVGSIAGLLAVLTLTATAHASAVPEMDPGGAVAAVTLLAGLAALAAGRPRRQ